MMSTTFKVSLSSTSGADWDKLATQYTRSTENPSSGAIKALHAATNAQRPYASATGILDNGCGPGVVMSALLQDYGAVIPEDCPLVCSDFSDSMIEQVNQTKQKQIAAGQTEWFRVSTIVSNAMDMNAVATDSQSHVLAGWVYFMTPDPQKCLAESKRVLVNGGVLGLTSWAGSQWLDVMRQLSVAVTDRAVPSLPEAWSSPEAVQTEMETAGFSDVRSEPIVVHMGYESHKELVKFLLYTMPHMVALSKGLKEEQMRNIEAAMLSKVKQLNPQEPGRLKGDAIVAVGSKL